MIKPERRIKRLAANDGFSLVELLVAVVILGIIAGPLLHTFVTGTYTAAKSRRIGDATLAAQNIAETIEANDIATIVTDPQTMFGASSYSLTGGDSAAKSGLPEYDFTLNGVTAGKSTFNAKVTMTAPSGEDGGNNAQFSVINLQAISDYSNMDAVFAQPRDITTDPDEQAYSAFAEEVQAADLNVTDVKRVITLTVGYFVDANGNTDKSRLSAMLEYKYRYTYSCTEIESDGTTAHKTKLWPLTDYHMVTSNLFPQGFDCTKTPSIYLMYNPWYSTVNLGSGEYNNSVGDKIEIYTKNNLTFKLFLVKEKISNLTTAMEIQYAADIVLYQDSVSIVSNAKVYSNAKENLMEPVGNQKIVNVSFKKQGIVMHTPQSFAGYDSKSEASENDVVSKSAKSRIYKITIMLYDTNNTDEDITSGTLVSTFTATKLQ